MMRSAKVGERCRVIDRDTGALIMSGLRRVKTKHKVTASWDFTKGNTGTVRRVVRYSERGSPTIYVEPDAEFGHGELWFWASELERIREAAGDAKR
jgi:hypothetical protein